MGCSPSSERVSMSENTKVSEMMRTTVAQDGIIVANKVKKVYETGKVRVEALRGVNISVREGEMVAIMGPSGCGKTTLLNCLSGLDDISAGEILIRTKPLSSMTDRTRTKYRAEKIGFIFQAYNLLPVLTAAENVELPLLLSGVPPKEARKKAVEALDAVGLKDWQSHKPAELSGGQQQRVTIARSLVNKPEIVFGDEPTGNLDSESSKDVMTLLRKLNKDNKQTFIIVTHDYNIGKMADRIVMMKDGLIEKEFEPSPF